MSITEFFKNADGASITPEAMNVEVKFKAEDVFRIAKRIADLEKELANQAEKEKTEEDLLSPDQVCKMLGVARSTLTRWQNAGYLVPAKIGGKCKYRKADIESIIKTKRI